MRALATGALFLLVLAAAGCNPEVFRSTVPATLDEINRIVDNSALTPQEQRQRLTDLGISASTINALLRSVRTGNQFGGDLRTAWDKVTGGTFTWLTADEIQIYGDGASAVDAGDDLSVTLTDDEAATAVVFFTDFGINTGEQLGSFLDQGGEPTGSIDPNVYRALFVDFDPNALIPDLP